MINIKKYFIISTTTLILIFPIFFGIFIKFFLINGANLTSITILLLGVFVLLLIGFLIEKYGYDSYLIELIRKHDLVAALTNKTNRIAILIFFLITMLMEELIFRYYSIGILYILLDLDYYIALLVSSLAFSLYHIHIWFSFKNLKLFLINIGYTFLLGMYLGYIFLYFGYVFCFIAHYIIAFSMHFMIYQQNRNI